MTHPNFQTNGASLEDCHTNFFALTELSGIKWRKLVWSEGDRGGGGGGPVAAGGHNFSTVGEPLEDPVLRSYARCLAADILCVWRRVSTPRAADMIDLGPPPPLSLSASKELWIFWYGEEPELNELVAPELNVSDSEQGSWESGLSYECRSLLFKALHNLIERCLLSRDFIRLGKWFVQPCDGPPKKSAIDVGNSHLSFSFAFFVHGESSVCASVDVRQHPPVRRLSRWHMQQAQTSTSGLKDCPNCIDDSLPMPNRWTMPLLKLGEKRYYLGIFFKANYYRATQYCRFHGMHLASITSQEENDKLEKYIKDSGFGHEHFWTSGTDLAEEGRFFWMSTGRPITFTNWNAGEPNNFEYENGEQENCLELWNRDGKGLKWNDSPCSFETYFVCEVQP
ncbi:hypothetical protein JTB14_005911 [Gonioctena quinquepunctata]|nr:hypothetical protein JTB14_005911 [Gonioctena quinquepunctata]